MNEYCEVSLIMKRKKRGTEEFIYFFLMFESLDRLFMKEKHVWAERITLFES